MFRVFANNGDYHSFIHSSSGSSAATAAAAVAAEVSGSQPDLVNEDDLEFHEASRDFLHWSTMTSKSRLHWPWTRIWRTLQHPAIEDWPRSIVWRMIHKRLPTPAQTKSNKPVGTICFACGEEAETAHLFLQCERAKAVWAWLQSVWNSLCDCNLDISVSSIMSAFNVPSAPIVPQWPMHRSLLLVLHSECAAAIWRAQSCAFMPPRNRQSELALSMLRRSLEQRIQRDLVCALQTCKLSAFWDMWGKSNVFCSASDDFARIPVIHVP